MKFASIMLTALLGVAVTAPAHAQDKSSREKQALQRAQQALREAQSERDELQSKQTALSAEKTSLEAEKTKLSGEVKKLGAVQSQARAAQARVVELEASAAQLKEQLAQAQAQNAEMSARVAEAQTRLRAVTSMLAASTQTQTVLELRNGQLYQVGLAAIELYRSQSPASTWAQRASPLGLGQVQIENAAEAMRTKLDDARYFTPPAPTTASAAR